MSIAPYEFTPDFQKTVAVAASCRPSLYGRGLDQVEPDGLTEAPAKLILGACRVLAAELKRGPDSTTIVLQKLRNWVAAGRVTEEQFDEAFDVICELEAKLPEDDSILGVLLPEIKNRLRVEAIDAMEEDLGKGSKELGKHADRIKEIDAIGQIDAVSVGVDLGPDAFKEIESLRGLSYMPIGIDELDLYIGGGLWRGAQGIFIGGPGEGKSVALCHVAGEAFKRGCYVGVVTLEISRPLWMARVIANITKIPIRDITDGYRIADAQQAIGTASRAGGLVTVTEMPASITTAEDVIQWVERAEKEAKRPMDMLVIDYIDRLGAKGGKNDSTYQTGLKSTEALRLYCQKNNKWNWTASQATRKNEKAGKIKGLDSVADSMHKVRVADLVITLNAEDDGSGLRQLNFSIAKNRVGESLKVVGPYPTMFECARLIP